MEDEQITFNDDGNSIAVQKTADGFRIVIDGSMTSASINLTADEFDEFFGDVQYYQQQAESK